MSTSTADDHSEMRRFKKSCGEFMDWRWECDKKKSDIKVDVDFDEFYRYIEELQRKENKKTIDLLVAGTTSAGKSALINSLLRMDVLASSVGHCTPGAVLIQPTDIQTAYYEFEDGRKFDLDLSCDDSIEAFWSEIDNVSKERTEDIIRLHLPHEQLHLCSILKKNVSIIDSPGMERDCFKSEKTKTMVKESDAVVILIDLTTGLNDKETVDLLTNSGFFVKPNVIIVFNKCDELDDERPTRRTKLIEQGIEQITAFMTKGKHLTEKEARENIFFLSAKEANRAWRAGRDLSETSESSSGVSWNGNQYISDERMRAVGHRTFEKRLMSIAVDNYDSMKAQRMFLAITQSRVDLLAKAGEVQRRLETVNQRILDFLSLQKAFTVLEREAKENSRYFYEKFMRNGESSIPGKEKVNRFLDFCRGEGSEPMRKVTEEICRKVDDQLALFARRMYEEGTVKTFDERKGFYEKLYVTILDPIEEYRDTAVAQNQEALEKLKRKREEERKLAADNLAKIQESFKQKEKQDIKEIERQRKELDQLCVSKNFNMREKVAMGLGAAGAACMAGGLVGAVVGGLLGTAGFIVGAWGRAAREAEEEEETRREISVREEKLRQTEEDKKRNRTRTEQEQLTELELRNTKATSELAIKEKNIQIEIERGKQRESDQRIKMLKARREEHIKTLTTFYQMITQDIQNTVGNSFQEKMEELKGALFQLQKLMKKHEK